MKKYTFIFTLLFLSHISIYVSAQNNENPQPFAPVGAKWYYQLDEFFNDTFEVTKDTLIEEKLCSVLKSSYLRMFVYLYQDQQKVYYWSEDSQSFNLLYNFSANVGDYITTILYGDPDYYIEYKVVKVDTVILSEIPLRRLYLAEFFVDGYYHLTTLVTERLGSNRYMLPTYQWEYPELLCYTDSEISYGNCTSGFEEINKDQLTLIVNNDFVQLPVKAEIANLYNISGQLVLSLKPDFENKISISTLQNGIYLIKVKTSDFNYLTFKFIKK